MKSMLCNWLFFKLSRSGLQPPLHQEGEQRSGLQQLWFLRILVSFRRRGGDLSQREIPSSNIELHSAHCARNLQKCEHCGEMVARKLMEEHYNENHAPVNCSLCKETLQREILDLHKSEQCTQRMVACEYCEYELPAVDLHEHQDVCGNRTEFCQTCKKYIRLREWIGHEIQCHINSNGSAESSSARTIPEREVRPPPPVRPARPAHGAQHKRLLFTIAVTGIAVMIGSILFQREESI